MCYSRSVKCAIVSAAVAISLILASVIAAEPKGLILDGLSFIPKGVVLGMSADDLQKLRPSAKVFRISKDGETSATRADMTKGNHVLIEELGVEAEFGGATYLVKNGSLVCITVSKNWVLPKDWHLIPDETVTTTKATQRKLRHKVLSECRGRLGDNYKTEAVSVLVSDAVKYLAPRLCWTNDQMGAALWCTSDYQDVDILQGFVSVSVWLPKDGFKPPLLPAQKVDTEVLSRLVQPLVKDGPR